MKKQLLTLITLLSLFLLNSCTSLNTVSLTSIPQQRNHPVKAEVSKFIFLAFTFDNDFVDELNSDLKRQCPNGMISGILTKDEVVNYFLYIFWTHRVKAEGYCVTAQNASTNAEKNPRKPSNEGHEHSPVVSSETNSSEEAL